MKRLSLLLLLAFILNVPFVMANDNMDLVGVENTETVDGDGQGGNTKEDKGWMAAAGDFFSGFFSSEKEEKLGSVLVVTKLGGYGHIPDEVEERYEPLKFDFTYLKNPDDEDFVYGLSMKDIVWVIAHGGVRPDGFIFAQTTLFGKAKNEIHQNYVKENAPYFGPALTIATACSSTQVDGMAEAIGGYYIGFPRAVNIASMVAFGKNAMNHIADKIEAHIQENPATTEDEVDNLFTEELVTEARNEGMKNKITGSGYIRGIGSGFNSQTPEILIYPRRGYEEY